MIIVEFIFLFSALLIALMVGAYYSFEIQDWYVRISKKVKKFFSKSTK